MHQRRGYFFRTCGDGRMDGQTHRPHTPGNEAIGSRVSRRAGRLPSGSPRPICSAVCVPSSWSLSTGSCQLCWQPGWLPPSSGAALGSPSPRSARWCPGAGPRTCGRPGLSGVGAGRCAPSRRTRARTRGWACRPCRPGGGGRCEREAPARPAPESPRDCSLQCTCSRGALRWPGGAARSAGGARRSSETPRAAPAEAQDGRSAVGGSAGATLAHVWPRTPEPG